MQNSVNFDRAVGFYDATRGLPEQIERNIGKFIAERANLNQLDTVLEIGAGTGRIALSVANYVKYVTGADISHGMLRVLQSKKHSSAVYPVQANGERLPYTDNVFNAVMVVHVLHLVPSPEKLLSEIRRVLVDNGMFLRGFITASKDNLSHLQRVEKASRPKSQSMDNRAKIPNIIASDGWQLNHEAVMPFEEQKTARQVYENIKNRVWSSLWEVSDEALQMSLDAISDAIDAHYDGNFDTTVTYNRHFTLQIFRQTS